jgi:hypothetical protein
MFSCTLGKKGKCTNNAHIKTKKLNKLNLNVDSGRHEEEREDWVGNCGN